jgi:hypothetical protein
VAHQAVLLASGLRLSALPFGHGLWHRLPARPAGPGGAASAAAPGAIDLVDSYHCSRYNTQTGRLTEAMFMTLMGQIRERLDRAGAQG